MFRVRSRVVGFRALRVLGFFGFRVLGVFSLGDFRV